ncbi:MAG: LysR family transcriptional regulator [Lachnospiraceae bacterium]|nr:LysR family transcriptional regulator [Lachnospiraceae bacterium]
MTLNQLRYFCVASRCHSITKAAQELYLTQPTVSVAIRDLEIEFGVSLFYRKGNQLMLTEEGEGLYEKANYILQYCNELLADHSSINRVKPPVRIGIPPMLSTVFFPELLDAFKDKYPSISVILDEYGSVRACNLVQDDTLDLALVNMELYNIDKFNREVLANDQIVFCVHESHPLAEKEVISTKEMALENLIFFNADSVQNELLKTRFELDGLTPNIFMRSSQIYTTIQFLKNGKCGCFLYSSMVNKFPGVVGIPLDPPIKVNIGMIWKKGKFISNDMQKVIHFTSKYYQEHSLVKI